LRTGAATFEMISFQFFMSQPPIVRPCVPPWSSSWYQKRKKQNSSEHIKIWQPLFLIMDHPFLKGPLLMPRKFCNGSAGRFIKYMH
jgi:hypothetical protein